MIVAVAVGEVEEAGTAVPGGDWVKNPDSFGRDGRGEDVEDREEVGDELVVRLEGVKNPDSFGV